VGEAVAVSRISERNQEVRNKYDIHGRTISRGVVEATKREKVLKRKTL